MSARELKNSLPSPPPSEKELDEFFNAVTIGNLSGTRAFLDKHPACIDQPIINSASPLIRAAIYQQLEVVRVLLAKGALADTKDLSDWTPLIYAARYGQTEMLDLLLEHGASIDMKIEASGLTALMFAVLEDRSDSVRLLLEKGAAADQKRNDGRTALMLAKERGEPEIVALLEEWQQRKERELADARAKISAAAILEKLKNRRPPQSPFKNSPK
jgi:ankyrin repeat protein